MTSPCGSNVHLRLVKKLPGQPPSGAIVPSAAPGEPAKFMLHELAAGEASTQRPAMGIGAGPERGAAATRSACGPGVAAPKPPQAPSAPASSIASTSPGVRGDGFGAKA